MGSIKIESSGPGFTGNAVLVPDVPPPWTTIVSEAVAPQTVTVCVMTPDAKFPLIIGSMVDVELKSSAVPVKPVRTIFAGSCASM